MCYNSEMILNCFITYEEGQTVYLHMVHDIVLIQEVQIALQFFWFAYPGKLKKIITEPMNLVIVPGISLTP